MKFNRPLLMKIHTLLAVFLLPVAIMFFVTGGLYNWGIEGEQNRTIHEIPLKKPLSSNLLDYSNLVEKQLTILGLSAPTGDQKLKGKEGRYTFEWSGSAIELHAKTIPNSLLLELELKESNWYRRFVQLHKAKGGLLFKVYATILSISLLTLLFTGLIMAWQMPKLRQLTFLSASLGMATFILLVIIS